MRCPFCDHAKDRVVDSRESREGRAIRRRRECVDCGRRFTTYERVEDVPIMVIKKGGNRESFQRSKVLKGLLTACEKRPVSPQQLQEIVDEVEKQVMEKSAREIQSIEIGELLMDRLRRIDKISYIRFASVYLDFKNVREFTDEINQLVEGN